jgi:hypothetical protein
LKLRLTWRHSLRSVVVRTKDAHGRIWMNAGIFLILA